MAIDSASRRMAALLTEIVRPNPPIDQQDRAWLLGQYVAGETRTTLPSGLSKLTTVDLIEMRGISQRASKIRWDLLDAANNVIGSVHPSSDQTPVMSVDTTRVVKRTLSQLWLPPDEADDVDVSSDRLKPWWVLENGAEFPLGIVLFADASRMISTAGSPMTGTMVDLNYVLNQAEGVPVSYFEGQDAAYALRLEWAAAGVESYIVEASDTVLQAPMTWPADTTRFKRMQDISRLASFCDPYFDNTGVGRSRRLPDPLISEASLVYADGDLSRVYADSIVQTDDFLSAPNRYICISTSASDVAVAGTYNVPAEAPYSAARRGFVVSAPTIFIQGATSPVTCYAAAKAEAERAAASYRIMEFNAVPDPRHDVYDIVELFGDRYFEVGWSLPLLEGSEHRHTLRRVSWP